MSTYCNTASSQDHPQLAASRNAIRSNKEHASLGEPSNKEHAGLGEPSNKEHAGLGEPSNKEHAGLGEPSNKEHAGAYSVWLQRVTSPRPCV